MIGPNLHRVIGFIRAARRAPLPPPVADMARRCLVDWMASATAALDTPEARALEAYAAGWRSQGKAMSLFGTPMAAAPAALVNGAIAHLLDYDDLNLSSAYHPSAATLAATIAMAMDRGASEADLLKAFVVGYEVGTAFGTNGPGLALVDRGWHPTAILAHLSATAACAFLLDLDEARIANAFGLAATQAGGLLAAGGSAAKPFQIGKAAMNGIMAAEAAAMGLDAPGDLLDDQRPGLFQALVGATRPIHDLGETWRILETTFKAYPCCQFAHAPLEAARQVATERTDDIHSVKIFVNPVSRRVAGNMQPQNATEARFSIAYAAALGLNRHGGIPEDFSETRLAEPDIRRVMATVELVTDMTIERWSSRIEVQRDNGNIGRATVIDPLGSAGHPMEWPDLRAKFIASVRPVFGARTEALLAELVSFGAKDAVDWLRSGFAGAAAAPSAAAD